MTYDNTLDLRLTGSRHSADDLEGAARDRSRERALSRGVPRAAMAGVRGPACDASNPAEWAGERPSFPE